MNYISDCCSAPAVEGTLNTWNDYEAGEALQPKVPLPDPVAMTYGKCSACKKPSKFWEAKIASEGE